MEKFTLRCSGTEEVILAECLADAMEQAEDWAKEGDYPEQTRTIWETVKIFDADNDYVGKVKVAIDPSEPRCKPGMKHDWQSPHSIVGGLKENPGVFGSGGGVAMVECCVVCGCQKETDTWAQDPADGEQGLVSISFKPNYYNIEETEEDEFDF